jgi:hypothetical protein
MESVNIVAIVFIKNMWLREKKKEKKCGLLSLSTKSWEKKQKPRRTKHPTQPLHGHEGIGLRLNGGNPVDLLQFAQKLVLGSKAIGLPGGKFVSCGKRGNHLSIINIF